MTTIDGEAVEVDEDNLPVVREPSAEGTALVARNEISVAELLKQSEIIEAAMRQAMTVDVHYGKIPGVQKPTLLKPGAEKLNVLFRLAPSYQSDKTWHEDGHLTVTAKCVLTHIPTSLVVGEGEGLCTTKESKYAYRNAQRACPECGEPQVRLGKARGSQPGNWYCWKKEGGCGATWALDSDQARLFGAMETGKMPNPDLADSYNCVTPDTRILTRDLRWVPAGELISDDVLVGINEELPNKNGRRYEDAVATVGDRFEDELFEIQAEDGRVVRCNGEHRWLVKTIGSGVEWVATRTIHDDLLSKKVGRRRKWRIMTVGSPWESEDSYGAGYMAGLLDADGCLGISKAQYHSVVVQFAQQAGGVLSSFISGLKDRAFGHRMYAHGNKTMKRPVYTIALAGGLLEQMRLLGTVRPARLIERWDTVVDLTQRRFEGQVVLVKSVKHIGVGELVRLGTSSHTYIAEGMVCHNTVLKMADKRALVAAVLNSTAASDVFTQDVEDNRTAGGSEPRSTADDRPAVDRAQLGQFLAATDKNLDWESLIGQAVQHVYNTELSKLSAAKMREVDGRMSDFCRELPDPASMPPASREEIVRAFAAAFEGAVVEIP